MSIFRVSVHRADRMSVSQLIEVGQVACVTLTVGDAGQHIAFYFNDVGNAKRFASALSEIFGEAE